MHQLGMVHCDAKPENIMLFGEPREMVAKVCDLGFTLGEQEARRVGIVSMLCTRFSDTIS